MSATSAAPARGIREQSGHTTEPSRRLSTETKAAFKTTEFIAYVAIVVGILISAAVVKASDGHQDAFNAVHAWLYVSIVTVGYMVSRGLAKSGSKQYYDQD